MKVLARGLRLALLAGVGTAVLTPAASASITLQVTLDQSAGTQAGSTVPLGMDIKFAPTGSDSPKDLTLILPSGLLSDASIDDGACLHASAPVAGCQVGGGSVTAAGLGLVPMAVPVNFYLVAPPKADDLAGVAVQMDLHGVTSELGSPGEVTVRPASDPAGVGLDIAFTDIPDTFNGAPISIDELQSRFSGLRQPTSCPATPAELGVIADSYSDPTKRMAGAPLHVTGCSKLAYTPAFDVTAVKDASDSGVAVSTDLTQPVSPIQATSRSDTLEFPSDVLAPNVAAVLSGGILCPDPSSGTCKTIGAVSSTSPLYPAPLTGKAYLTGSLSAPAIALVFPPPFALTLYGNVDVSTNSTTFYDLPDIPLTALQVVLTGGPDSAFVASCAPASGTATSTLTSQNGDRTITLDAPFTVAGCSSSSGGSGSGGSGSGSGGGGSGSSGSGGAPPPPHGSSGRPRIARAFLSGVGRLLPTLRFKAVAGPNAPKLEALTISLPRGLGFSGRRRVKLRSLRGVSVIGGRIKWIAIDGGRLVIVLRRAVSSLTVVIGVPALAERHALAGSARHHPLRRFRVIVVIGDATRRSTVVVLQLRNRRSRVSRAASPAAR